jgi:hypothetical protein
LELTDAIAWHLALKELLLGQKTCPDLARSARNDLEPQLKYSNGRDMSKPPWKSWPSPSQAAGELLLKFTSFKIFKIFKHLNTPRICKM